jgi:hypothetical protein
MRTSGSPWHICRVENGVADELKMDFGEFVVDGRLGELQPIPSPC